MSSPKVSIEELRLVFRVLTDLLNGMAIHQMGFSAVSETRREVATWIVMKEQAHG
jgi:hypothetical protein